MSDIIVANPSNPSVAVAGIPASLPQFPLDPKSKDETVREAARLHAFAAEKTATLKTVRDAHSDAIGRVRKAKVELQELIAKGASTGQIDQEAELQASLAVSAAERLADPEVHVMRQRVALQEQRQAVAAFYGFVSSHAAELFETLRPEAEAATEALVEAEASIAGERDRYRAAQNASQQLGAIIAASAGERAQEVSRLLGFPTSAGSVPMPSDEALQLLTPRELVTLDAD
jgi:hypothetical protein